MKESIFNNDDKFFKSTELTEQGLLKAKYLRKIGTGKDARYIYKETGARPSKGKLARLKESIQAKKKEDEKKERRSKNCRKLEAW